MIFKYDELKEYIGEDFVTFHDEMKFTIEQTIPAILNEYENAADFSLLEECSIYVFISLILIEQNLNTDTLREKIIKLLNEENMKVYKEQLGDEYSKFVEDVIVVKKNLSL